MNRCNYLLRIALSNVSHLNGECALWNHSTIFGYVPLRNFKSDLKIKWVRPVKPPSHSPARSGDLAPIDKIDRSRPRLEFENHPELEDADANVKKIFSLEFQLPIQTYISYRRDLSLKVKRHEYDANSHEVQIAKMTARIRYLQEYLTKYPKNVKKRVECQELIDKRKKFLKYLRRWDYKRFEWLLEKLNLVYRPSPIISDQVTRKKSLTLLTALHCETIKQKRLAEYRTQLNDRKLPFLEKKIEKLKWVQSEEAKNNLPPTVSDADIDECIAKLEQVKLHLASVGVKVPVPAIDPYYIEPYDS